ncbi:hypothetical protein HMPREF0971_01357 [Segatella oris F0302]|uniref:Uncharacterized protein n=1 Tax=Segatella oris F0302 TaxID=649760 RepID=D1QQV5_9BACT|nr:hypothetical protein HMPREF0971_01357 [Segatella oris F0302]
MYRPAMLFFYDKITNFPKIFLVSMSFFSNLEANKGIMPLETMNYY